MQTSQSEMLDGLKDGRYIDFWQQEDRFHCIRLKSVTDICDQVSSTTTYLLFGRTIRTDRLSKHSLF
ncbi:hypothetical protein DPMN_035037 [Dreissena polymorpha]|uniref:Uncharacterized protein n=1 Tax=Dreissena polymorpha TaxID=45954 RepID=A0A9D4M6J2_DREPO|nr:hypothetical protein DPMN_035037 [Dreissena polymorpha]